MKKQQKRNNQKTWFSYKMIVSTVYKTYLNNFQLIVSQVMIQEKSNQIINHKSKIYIFKQSQLKDNLNKLILL